MLMKVESIIYLAILLYIIGEIRINEIINMIFNLFMLPFEKLALHKRRSEIIPKVSRNVLEVGSGGGMNFNYYQADNIEKLTVLDLKFNRAIKKHKLNKKLDIDYLVANAEQIPLKIILLIVWWGH